MKFNFKVLEKCRLLVGEYGSSPFNTFGVFYIPYQSYLMKVLATNGEGVKPQWEHVSVSLKNRCPNWQEMSYIKSLFWDEEETVVQFHPPKSQYVNKHPYCLHLWRKVDFVQPLPPKILVG